MLFLIAAGSNIAKATADDLDIFRFIPGYSEAIVGDGKEPVLLLLLAFLITFMLTRLYTRLARVYGWGSGSVGGVHLHHMVVGILIVLVTGVVAVAEWPTGIGRDLIGIFFGIGAALVLDEFALSLYLEDVYWSPEGRTSIDATIMGVMLAGLLMVGTSPFGVNDAHYSRTIAFGVIALNIVLATITFLKGKLMLGLAGIFVPLIGLVGVLRLAKPRSAWARWFYKRNPAKVERARQRYEVHPGWPERFNTWFTNLVGGAPSRPSPPKSPPPES
ncbi:MAG: hypothetical protein H0W87_07480 [Actinobacteria bacterium]|nr:hypothetical protein [Actinomycetota bacterium]